MNNDKLDNLIHLKGDVDYQAKSIYNIQEDVKLILNVRVPEIKQSLSTLNNNISSLNNNVNSLGEIIKIKEERMDKKLIEIKKDTQNIFWAVIVFDICLFITSLLLH